jgi:REP element-mobilizing transposase RayT
MRDHPGAFRTHFAMQLLPAVLNRDREGAPTTYLITWVCYGAWLPGLKGAIPRTQNGFGARLPKADAARERRSKSRMPQEPYLLDSVRRLVVLNSLKEVCCHHGWTLLAAHVRTNHVHLVVTGNCKPESIMITLKAYNSRALNRYALDQKDRRRWARHGSTRYLWTRDGVQAAIQYVVHGQGERMDVFQAPALAPR